MASLINKSAVRRAALDISTQRRAHRFTRVSVDFLNQAEAHLRTWITNRIDALPSSGKTIN